MPDNSFSATFSTSPYTISNSTNGDTLIFSESGRQWTISTNGTYPGMIILDPNANAISIFTNGTNPGDVYLGNAGAGWHIDASGNFKDMAANFNTIFDQYHNHYDNNGTKVLGLQGGAISSPALTAPTANETALLTALNAILAALRGSSGHGIIGG